MYALVLLVLSADGLGGPRWERREWAEYRLRVLGVLAVPSLLEAERSDSPEARQRATAILKPWRCLWRDVQAARLLLDPWATVGMDPEAFWRDRDLRRRVHRIASERLRGHYQIHNAVPMLMDSWYVCVGGWFETTLASWAAFRALECCRSALGADPGWPFRN